MSTSQVFPFSVALLCAAAGIVYVYQGNWRLAIVWFAYCAADIAIAV